LSSSTGERSVVAAVERLFPGGLDAWLAAVAAAPDYATAARFLVAQFADGAGAERGYALMLDPAAEALVPVAAIGYDADRTPRPRPLVEAHDPLVAAALSLRVVRAGDPLGDGPGRSFAAIPFPQPRSSQLPDYISSADAEHRLPAGCRLVRGGGGAAARGGTSPCGVVVLEADPPDDVLRALAEAGEQVGPVLWRIFAAEEFRRSTRQLDAQSSVLTAIVNSLPDPIVIINAEHEIIVQNRRAEHLLSMADTDSEGRRRAVEINNLLFTSHLSKTAIAPTVGAGSRELNMVDPDDGTDLLFEVLTQQLDEAGRGATVSVLRDVTDLRRAAGELERQVQRVSLAEIEAKRERDRLNLILTNVADPILVTDDRSNIILMNRQAEQLFGGASADESQTSAEWAAAVRANDTRFTTFVSGFSISSDFARREQMTLFTPGSGGSFPVEVVSGKILDRRGEAIAIVSVLHDLTEQVENERLLQEVKTLNNDLEGRVHAATADLAEQNLRLQWQSRELEKANRLKSEFLASMSHELRTPINALIGYTALLLDRIYGELNGKQEEGLTRIQVAAQHLLALINDILDLAKIEAGRMPLHLDDVTLQDILREANMQIEPLVRRKGLYYRWEFPDEPVPMHTDRTKIKQIMLNLLSNAVKFTHTGGVTLRATVDDGNVELSVTDTGIGIREQDLDAIWEDFRQVDQSRTREFGGTGLGLSITRKLTEALGGRIVLRSRYGEGSSFTVTMPLHLEAGELALTDRS